MSSEMSEKIPIARNLSDRKSREWWAAIDEIALRAPKLELKRTHFGQSTLPASRPKPSSSRAPRSRKQRDL